LALSDIDPTAQNINLNDKAYISWSGHVPSDSEAFEKILFWEGPESTGGSFDSIPTDPNYYPIPGSATDWEIPVTFDKVGLYIFSFVSKGPKDLGGFGEISKDWKLGFL
jgi:hypothetical protein